MGQLLPGRLPCQAERRWRECAPYLLSPYLCACLWSSCSISGVVQGAGGTFSSKTKIVCCFGIYDFSVRFSYLATQTEIIWGMEFIVEFFVRKIYLMSLKSTNGLFSYLQDSASGKTKLPTYAAGRSYSLNILSPVPVKEVGALKSGRYTSLPCHDYHVIMTCPGTS